MSFNEMYEHIDIFNSGVDILNIVDRYSMDISMDLTQFGNKDAILQTLSLFIDKIQGSYILGIKIVLVVFMFI
jgi:hypothetical protein